MSMASRRSFLHTVGAAVVSAPLVRLGPYRMSKSLQPLFTISLAEWSFHRTLFAGEMDHLDFPLVARRDYGIDGVEYVNQFFKDKAKDQPYLRELKQRCEDNGVRSLLIMCDGEGFGQWH